MIPNKEIYKRPNKTVDEPHLVSFSKETIEQLRNDFHKNNLDNHVNINHDGILVSGVLMTDSFLINNKNRILLDEKFHDLPTGTWMVEYKIEDESIWQLVKNKELNGFSIEGMFEYGEEK
jgi:hypothetical protein